MASKKSKDFLRQFFKYGDGNHTPHTPMTLHFLYIVIKNEVKQIATNNG